MADQSWEREKPVDVNICVMFLALVIGLVIFGLSPLFLITVGLIRFPIGFSYGSYILWFDTPATKPCGLHSCCYLPFLIIGQILLLAFTLPAFCFYPSVFAAGDDNDFNFAQQLQREEIDRMQQGGLARVAPVPGSDAWLDAMLSAEKKRPSGSRTASCRLVSQVCCDLPQGCEEQAREEPCPCPVDVHFHVHALAPWRV